MDKEAATIWVKLGEGRKNSIVMGGVYREHQQLGRTDPAAIRLEIQIQQEKRWSEIIKKWKLAARYPKCMIIGDINLDFLMVQPRNPFTEYGGADTRTD